MSSFWDLLGQRLKDGELTKRELLNILGDLHTIDHATNELLSFILYKAYPHWTYKDRDLRLKDHGLVGEAEALKYIKQHQIIQNRYKETKVSKRAILKAMKISDEDFEKIILGLYQEHQREIDELHGAHVLISIDVELLQKRLWQRYKISRPVFLELFKVFYKNQPTPGGSRTVKLYGSPTSHYKKRNWVDIEGKHYTLFSIDVERYRAVIKEREES